MVENMTKMLIWILGCLSFMGITLPLSVVTSNPAVSLMWGVITTAVVPFGYIMLLIGLTNEVFDY